MLETAAKDWLGRVVTGRLTHDNVPVLLEGWQYWP
jgi:hypothetical protein